MTTGPDRAHGTWRRYRYDGCKCDPCVRAWSGYVQQRLLDQIRGCQRLVDATPAVEHVKSMVDQWGVAKHRVWEAGGCSSSMGHRLMAGQSTKMDRNVADQVCAVTIEDLPDDCWMFRGPLDALVADIRKWTGWSYRTVSLRAGLVDTYLIDMRRHGAVRVTVGTWRALRALAADVEPVDRATVWLPVEPIEAFLSRPGVALIEVMPDRSLARAWYRAVDVGRISDLHADRICVRVLGLTLEEVYGPNWDEVAA